MTKSQKLEQFKTQCQEKGIKLTPQRLIIYQELIGTEEHPTADIIYNKVKVKFPMISLDTVHRTLVTFCEIGVASMVEGTGSPKRFEGNLDTHHHARCVQCGKIIDFYSAEYDRLPVPSELQQEFSVFKKTVYVEGLCGPCRQERAHEG
jgi:Fur family peroxide stress response transcriptional regulator